jgi:bacteriocin-like protein
MESDVADPCAEDCDVRHVRCGGTRYITILQQWHRHFFINGGTGMTTAINATKQAHQLNGQKDRELTENELAQVSGGAGWNLAQNKRAA